MNRGEANQNGCGLQPEPETPLTSALVKELMNSAQGPRAAIVIAECERRLGRLGPADHIDRFWLLSVQFICAQATRTTLDEHHLLDEMMAAAKSCGLVPAQVAARAFRALLAATQGRYAQANPDLSQAVVLSDEDTFDHGHGWPHQHLRVLACNALSLAFTRQGFHEHAIHWLRRHQRLIEDHSGSEQFAASIVTFNEAWVHLTVALEQDLGQLRSPEAARTAYRCALALFHRAEQEATHESGQPPAAGPAGRLAAVAAILAGDTADGCVEELAEESLLRPDHRALQLLALAHIRGATDLLDDALDVLPTDHSFRSITDRICWEKARLASIGAPVNSAPLEAYRRMVGLLLEERRSEHLTRVAAYQESLQQERSRVALVAERAAADLDPLTGLRTRRALEEQLGALLSRRGTDTVIHFVFVDLDGFKQINDLRSHLAGDLTLQHFGETARRHLRGEDFAARYGGDEFIVVLTERTLTQTYEVLHHMQREMGEFTSTHPDIGIRITFTAGITTVAEASEARELLHRADLAMIAGKRAGRGHIVGPSGAAPPLGSRSRTPRPGDEGRRSFDGEPP